MARSTNRCGRVSNHKTPLDEMLKLCHSFMQLLIINTFVQKDNTKQVPLVYVLMISRKIQEYETVFELIINLIAPNNQSPSVLHKIMVDYEKGLCSALKELLPKVRIVGSIFHWT